MEILIGIGVSLATSLVKWLVSRLGQPASLAILFGITLIAFWGYTNYYELVYQWQNLAGIFAGAVTWFVVVVKWIGLDYEASVLKIEK